ncbi:MAG: twin-arginine translocation signal domain-containing protein [Desulfobacteraceae bacterium]|nr:twin-arginine translocation signal domain-containing protein [Desulfobacteraceae bacterium]
MIKGFLNRTLTRRRFLEKSAWAGAMVALTGLRPFAANLFADVRTYRGNSFLPPAYRAIRFGIDGFVENLKQVAPEGMGIEFFDSGTLMKADAQLPGLRVGNIQFMFHSSTYIADALPILGVIELPGICEHLYEHGERMAMESSLWNLINDQLAKDNLFMLSSGGGIMEPEYIWSSSTKVTSLSDLNGKRCRIVSPVADELLKRFGVTGMRLPSSKILLALQRRSIDAVLAPVNTIVARNLQEHLRYCYQLPVTGATHAVFLLKDYWEQMPESHKAAFWQAGKWYDENQAIMGYKKIPIEQYWATLEKAGIQIVRPTSEEQSVFVKNAKPNWQAWENLVGESVGRRAIDLALGKA